MTAALAMQGMFLDDEDLKDVGKRTMTTDPMKGYEYDKFAPSYKCEADGSVRARGRGVAHVGAQRRAVGKTPRRVVFGSEPYSQARCSLAVMPHCATDCPNCGLAASFPQLHGPAKEPWLKLPYLYSRGCTSGA